LRVTKVTDIVIKLSTVTTLVIYSTKIDSKSISALSGSIQISFVPSLNGSLVFANSNNFSISIISSPFIDFFTNYDNYCYNLTVFGASLNSTSAKHQELNSIVLLGFINSAFTFAHQQLNAV